MRADLHKAADEIEASNGVEDAHGRMTAFRFDILKTTELADLSGSQIKSQMESLPGYKEVHHGRLYPNLDILVELGLIDKGTRDRRTNEYVITDKGRKVIEVRRQWMNAGDEVFGNE